MKDQDKKISAVVASGIMACLFAFSLATSQAAENPRKKLYDSYIDSMSRKHYVPVDLIHSVIQAESNYFSRAVSAKGAIGLMQLMPETAKAYGVVDPFNPIQNIEGGVRYLKDLIKLFNGKTSSVLAAYNAGQEAVKKYNGIPPYNETMTYIRRVMASYDKPFIPRAGGKIYKRYDINGRLVLTNDPYFGFVKIDSNN